MRIAYFDCAAGASGDMILGALVDAGYPLAALQSSLAALAVDGWRVDARAVERGGLHGMHLVVETASDRRFPDLQAMLAPLETSALPARVKAGAEAIIRRLAEAESRVHRVPTEAVHFHEVGALDTLVDVVGAVAGLEALGIDRVHVSALPLGGGSVNTAHGRLPVPAPATAELLRGFPVYDNGVRAELVTPTGAAILTTLATPGPAPAMMLDTIGWGAGTRELAIPNLLRVLIGPVAAGSTGEGVGETEALVTVETTIDDMSPQLYEPLMERLLEAGALDVYLTPVVMKRSRPGVVLTALVAPEHTGELADILFRETPTIGVRWSEGRRRRLPRELIRRETPLGPVTFKVSRLNGRVVTVTPEFAEVRRIARERGLPVREALAQAHAAGRQLIESTE
ncbi:MAG TPA: nickel pincer cofactor biosynthesis protein LarC [Methylomirabilota bacterium]|nr:nickel pincer cofactor biosynthesis protein LarC [Methylomirabilota bacterium]